MPSNIVLSYDGVTTPSSPIVFEEICEDKKSNQIFYVSSNTSKLNLAHYWYGYTEKNQTISGQTGSGFQLWPGADNTSSSYDAWFHHTSDRGSDKYEFDNNEEYSTSGIKLIMGLTDKMTYMRVLSLNNTIFEIKIKE